MADHVTEELELRATAAAISTDAALNSGPEEYPTGLKFMLITAGLILSIFLAALDQNILATAIPAITDQFGSISDIAWYGTAYSITNSAFQSSWGKAYRVFPHKPTFLTAIVVFELGNLICGLATSSEMLIAGRIVSGAGGGGVMTGAFILIAVSVKPQYRPAYMGILGVTFGCASVIGPLLGGLLTDGPGWKWCFLISLPIGGLAAAIMAFFFRQPRASLPGAASIAEKIKHLDPSGSVLVATALSCFVLSMHWSALYSWSSVKVLGSLIGAAGLFLLFLLNEIALGPQAMVQAHLLRNTRILVNLTFVFFLAGLFFPLQYILPVQFQSINSASAQSSGLRLIPLVLGVSIFTMVANAILTYWKHYLPFLFLGAISSTAGAAAIATLDQSTSTLKWIFLEVLTAMGVGLSLQIPMVSNQALVGAADLSSATSLSLFVENMGTTLFVAAGEAAFTNSLVEHVKHALPQLDALDIVNVGATQIRSSFGPGDVKTILLGYLRGCQVSEWMSVACGGAASAIAIGAAGPFAVRGLKRKMGREDAD